MVKPKKYLGQHFLRDQNIAEKIAGSLTGFGGYHSILEIGPGTGVLTRFLVNRPEKLTVVEVDSESVEYLRSRSEFEDVEIIEADFLSADLGFMKGSSWCIIGNFPYNISSQLFFRILEIRDEVPEVVCMIQKEVAQRLASPPGSKKYGILSVLLQAWFEIEYLFTVPPDVFHPPPKVDSGVIRLKRNQAKKLDCDEKLFKRVVKTAFQNRRKTLRNALKALNLPAIETEFDKISLRAEQLSVNDFVELTQIAGKHGLHR